MLPAKKIHAHGRTSTCRCSHSRLTLHLSCLCSTLFKVCSFQLRLWDLSLYLALCYTSNHYYWSMRALVQIKWMECQAYHFVDKVVYNRKHLWVFHFLEILWFVSILSCFVLIGSHLSLPFTYKCGVRVTNKNALASDGVRIFNFSFWILVQHCWFFIHTPFPNFYLKLRGRPFNNLRAGVWRKSRKKKTVSKGLLLEKK